MFGECERDCEHSERHRSAGARHRLVPEQHADWQGIGTAAESDPFLSKNGGLDVETHSAADALLQMDSASATSSTGTTKDLNRPTRQAAYTDLFPSGPLTLKTGSGTTSTTGSLTLAPGVYKAVTLKPGPFIGRIYPAASAVSR